jgi:stage II sporulation protein D
LKKILLAVFGAAALVLLIPLVFSVSRNKAPDKAAEPAPPSEPPPSLTISILDGDQTLTMDLETYLVGVVAGEMPASFEEEALKAQVVAARSFILYRIAPPGAAHPGAAVCDDAACCLAYRDEQSLRELWGGAYSTYVERMRTAVRETDGQYLAYEDAVVQAVFHSSSAGFTESSAALWSPVPYLLSVSSPETKEDVPNYITTVEVSAEDFRKSVLEVSPASNLSGPPDTWLGETRLDVSGRVESVAVGGAKVTGSTLRGLFSLRSTCFTLEYTGGSFLFTVTGYGHGVGMSQYGANVMAIEGSDYREILAHYYPGTALVAG